MQTNELTQSIGLRLKAARQAQGLSLAQLAERTGKTLSKSRISNYEQGIRRMNIETAQVLAKSLGTTTATYLLCLDDTAPELSDEEQRLLGLFRHADATGRLRILEAADQADGG